MTTRLPLCAIIVLAFVASVLARAALREPDDAAVLPPENAQRIISMAPSATETLFALGLGDRVVGVTRYCDYPPEATERPQIGGYHNPNFEAVVSLRPDLVVLLEGSASSRESFAKLGIPVLEVCHKSLDGILDSMRTIGRATGSLDRAEEMVAQIETRMHEIRQKTDGLPQPRVMVVLDRTLGNGKIQNAYVAGADGHLDRMVELAGGQNACPPTAARFPVVSSEGMLRINPEVIIDLVSEIAASELDRATIEADWQQLDRIDAVRQGRVYVVDAEYATVPGPRFIRAVEDFARLLHPEVEWQ